MRVLQRVEAVAEGGALALADQPVQLAGFLVRLVRHLDAADLAAACQDSWLIHTESPDYRMTQRWAHWLRDSSAPDGYRPAGLMWPAKRQPGGRAVLLFGDRCGDVVLCSSFGERPLDDDAGLDWLNLRLALLRTKIRR